MSPATGPTIAGYTILRLLGSGAMAEVNAARASSVGTMRG